MIAKESLRALADDRFKEIAENVEKQIDERLIKLYTMGWYKLRVHSNEPVYGKDIDHVYCENSVVLGEIIEKYRAAGYNIIKCGRGQYDIYVDDELYEEHVKEIEQKELKKPKAEEPLKKSFWHKVFIREAEGVVRP